jgi:hypothetical protein
VADVAGGNAIRLLNTRPRGIEERLKRRYAPLNAPTNRAERGMEPPGGALNIIMIEAG